MGFAVGVWFTGRVSREEGVGVIFRVVVDHHQVTEDQGQGLVQDLDLVRHIVDPVDRILGQEVDRGRHLFAVEEGIGEGKFTEGINLGIWEVIVKATREVEAQDRRHEGGALLTRKPRKRERVVEDGVLEQVNSARKMPRRVKGK